MDIYWYGHSEFKLKGKDATILIDPYDPEMVGLKAPKPADTEANIVLQTHDHPDHSFLAAAGEKALKITGPGEYEVKGVMINGITTPHDKTAGSERGKNTVFHLLMDRLNIVHLGDLGDLLTEEQVQEIGSVDILLIPVGGTYTITSKEAVEVVTQLEPKIIIPMHYNLPGLKFPLEEVDQFLKEMASENIEPQAKLSITVDKLPEEPQIVVLTKA